MLVIDESQKSSQLTERKIVVIILIKMAQYFRLRLRFAIQHIQAIVWHCLGVISALGFLC